MKTNYVLIIPLWGRKHAELWLKYSLPSYLAENNFPYLAKNSNFSILICTDKKTESFFQESAEYRPLLKQYNLSFFNVSHIISKYPPHYYGYILTSCYHEAIQKYGALAHDIHFIFLNADFILADGVFKTVHHLVKKGSEIIFCPSFRVSREGFVPQLDSCITKRESMNVLSVPPRKLVALAFEHIHPTVTAQTINEAPEISTLITNQFYWRAEKNVLLGHHFLIFPFVVKPTHIPHTPTGYIDYNMAYDFHPKGEITYIHDSDDAFIVEPEYEYKECEYFTVFPKNDINYYFKNLSQWVNKLHYNNFKQLLVFHTQTIKPESDSFIREKKLFHDFIEKISSKFTKYNPFKPFIDHPYWSNRLSNILAWRRKFSSFVIKLLRRKIEEAAGIKLDTVFFFIGPKKNSGFNRHGNILHVNYIDAFTVENAYKKNILYANIVEYFSSDLSNAQLHEACKNIYLFSLDSQKESVHGLLSKYAGELSVVKDPDKHKALLFSIKEIHSCQGILKRKIVAVLKVLFLKKYLKFRDPLPYFCIFKISLKKP